MSSKDSLCELSPSLILKYIFRLHRSSRFALLLINQFISSVDPYTMVFLLFIELTSSSHTSLAGNLVLLGFTLGEATVTILARLTRDWLLLKWIITGHYSIALIYLYFIPESPYWLLSVKKYDRLEAWLRKIATRNGREEKDWYPYYIELIEDPTTALRSTKHASHTSKDKILRFLPRLSMGGFVGFCYYATLHQNFLWIGCDE